MGCDHTALDLVARLAAWARTPSRLDVDITKIQLETLLDLGIEDSNGDRRGLDTSTLLSGWDALVAVPAGFVLEERFGSLALEEDSNESRTVV